jgi:hemerythrin
LNPLSGNVSTSCKDVRFGAKVKTSSEEKVLQKYEIPSLSHKKSIDSFKRTSNNDVDLKEIQNHKEKHSEVLAKLKKILLFQDIKGRTDRTRSPF